MASFAALLVQHRFAAGLTQEALADRASVSVAAISSLERGVRRFPQSPTVAAIADALGLAGGERDQFFAAALRQHSAPRDVPRELPAAIPDFVGRQQEVGLLIDLLGRTTVEPTIVMSAITGMGGVGKTALALHAGHLAAKHFPDGQLYVNLRGFGPGQPMHTSEALWHLLRSLGVPAERIPNDVDGAAARYRSILAGTRVLVILDNVADVEQATSLLPGAAGCAAIVTSRRTLARLPGSGQIQLDVFSEEEAVGLLESIAGRGRIRGEIDAAREIVRHCGRLPLAVRLAGARLVARPHWPIRRLADRLAVERLRIDELEVDASGVRASLASSIDQLPASAAEAFGFLGIGGVGELTTLVAARLLGRPENEAERSLERLVDAHLLSESAPGVYRVHDLLRTLALEHAESTMAPAERAAALTRMLDLYVAVAWRTTALVQPHGWRRSLADPEWEGSAPAFQSAHDAVAWLDDQRTNLVDAVRRAIDAPDIRTELGVWLTVGLFGFYATRRYWLDWSQVTRAALDVVDDVAEPTVAAIVRNDLGLAEARLAESGSGSFDDAIHHLREALAIFRQCGNRRGEAACLTNLGLALELAGRLDDSRDSNEQSLALYEELGDENGQAMATGNLANAYGRIGDRRRQLRYLHDCRELLKRVGHEHGLARAAYWLGTAYRDDGDLDEARGELRTSVDLFERAGDPAGAAEALYELGAVCLAGGNRDDAQNHWLRALTICERDDHPLADEIRSQLALLSGGSDGCAGDVSSA